MTLFGQFYPALVIACLTCVTLYLLRALKETRNTNKSLSDHAHMLEAVINHASEGIIVLNRDKLISSANTAAQSMFQYSGSELIGKSIESLIASSESIHGQLQLQKNNILNLDSLVRERFGIRKDGRTFAIALSVAALKFGQDTLITLIISDISERRNMEKRLLQAEKMNSIGQLASGVAHEINTPIQYIGNNVAFIRNEFEKLETVLASYNNLLSAAKTNSISEELISHVEKESANIELDYLRKEVPNAISESIEGIDRVADIVRSLKEFAHPGQDEKTLVNINELIESTIIVSRNTWKYVADLSLQLDPSLPTIPAYAGDLKQVILNLIINSAHAIEEKQGERGKDKGAITVSTKKTGDNIEMSIADTGIGIAPENIAKVFEPFFTTKDVGKGTGQGLAISKRIIVEKHRGSLDFDSTPGELTTFRILLPLMED